MIDLHLHLDGSLTPREIRSLADLSAVELPTRDERKLAALLSFDGRGTLNDYLKKFELPLSVLQSAEAVAYAVFSLSERLAALRYEYAEIRFAPILHTRKGASAESILQGAIKGLSDSEFPAKLILCCMRGAEKRENLLTVELAARYRDQGVVGVDLAGAEALYPTDGYKEVFSLASRFGLNITIHAGEAAGAESVRAALDFGAKRIGHGVRVTEDESLLERIKASDVLIESCPTSNLQTGAVPSLAEHPIGRFLEAGVPVSLCSDNMTVSDTDLPREWAKTKAALSLSDEALTRLNDNARAHEFF